MSTPFYKYTLFFIAKDEYSAQNKKEQLESVGYESIYKKIADDVFEIYGKLKTDRFFFTPKASLTKRIYKPRKPQSWSK